MAVEVAPVAGRRDLDAFLSLPWRLYRGCREWVPPLLDHQRHLLDRSRHPFHQHAAVELFLARSSGAAVGRIAAIDNREHNAYHREQTGFFGFFESVDDHAVAGGLLDAAGAWLDARGLRCLRGPASFSTNEECGLLVEGFRHPPVFMMAYNHPYYAGLLEACGLSGVKDFYAFYVGKETAAHDRIRKVRRLADRARSRPEVAIRAPDMKHFEREVAAVRAVYTGAWVRNWGFVPMTDAEFDSLAGQLRELIVPRLTRIVTVAGQPAGFGILLPDYNQAIRHTSGRLWPFGLPIIFGCYHLRLIRGLRLIAMGVVLEHQRKGLEALIMDELYSEIISSHYQWCELGWTLEENQLINNTIRAWGGQMYKRYRIYERAL